MATQTRKKPRKATAKKAAPRRDARHSLPRTVAKGFGANSVATLGFVAVGLPGAAMVAGPAAFGAVVGRGIYKRHLRRAGELPRKNRKGRTGRRQRRDAKGHFK